jgi:hypothetical protein
VLTDAELKMLFAAMRVIQERFATLYGRSADPTINIEYEFKVNRDGQLLIEQVRAWLN